MFKIIQLFILCFGITAVVSITPKLLLRSWDEHENNFYVNQQENVVLIIDDTGIGKTTLTAILQSEEDCADCDLNQISDQEGKIPATSHSEFTIPQRMININSNTAFYYCPGFEDSSSPEHSITRAYFLNHLLKSAKFFKFVLIVDHADIQKEESLKNIVILFKNIDTYKNGIAMVVRTMERKLEEIEESLQNVKKSITERILLKQLSEDQLNFDLELLKLIDALLVKTENRFDRIGILHETPLIQSDKNNIKKIINNLQFVGQNKTLSFGFKLSRKSRTIVNTLIYHILDIELFSYISIICRDLKQYCKNKLKEKKDFNVLNSTFSENLRVLSEIKSKELLLFMEQLLDAIHYVISDSRIGDLRKYIKWMEFLRKFTNTKLFTPVKFSDQIAGVISDFKLHYNANVDKWLENFLQENMPRTIKAISTEITQFYLELEEKTTDIFELHNYLSRAHTELSKVDIAKPQSLVSAINDLEIAVSRNRLLELNDLSEKMRPVSKIITKFMSLMESSKVKFKDTMEQLQNDVLWYGYMIILYNHLSSPDHETFGKDIDVIQSLINACNTSNIVHEFGFERLSEFVPNNIKALTGLGNLYLNIRKKETLRMVLYTLIEKPWILCQNFTHMTVMGIVIRMSQIAKSNCWRNDKYIEIFATDSVIIDSSIEIHGTHQITIISPKWTIFGTQHVLVTGEDGKKRKWSAQDYNDPSQKGVDGKAGFPGGPGGNFLGIGEVFNNGISLTITSKGGKGGRGQNGGRGPKGSPGTVPHIPNNVIESISSCYDSIFFVTWCLKHYCDVNGIKYDDNIGSEKNSVWMRGEDGTNSGTGGDGGIGGFGGKHGHIKIIELGLASSINKNFKDGDFGDIGEGGAGGPPSDISFTEYLNWMVEYRWVNLKRKTYIRYISFMNIEKSEKGASGKDGQNYKNLSFPEPARDFDNPLRIINTYKKYLRNKSEAERDFRRSKFEAFIVLLENHGNVRKLFSPTQFDVTPLVE